MRNPVISPQPARRAHSEAEENLKAASETASETFPDARDIMAYLPACGAQSKK